MTKHTPGPWKSKPSLHGKKYRYVQIGNDENYTTLELRPADARLISAAPDMLDALNEALGLCTEGIRGREIMGKVRAAIAKATATAA